MRYAYNLSGVKIQFSNYLPAIKIYKKKWVEFSQIGLIIGIILLSMLNIAALSIENPLNVHQKNKTDKNTNNIVQKSSSDIPRTILSNNKQFSSQSYLNRDQSLSNTKYARGPANKLSTQVPGYTGTVSGTGATQLKLNESLDTTNTISNSEVNNSFTSTSLSKTMSVSQNINGYSNSSGIYSITNIKATYNYTNVENDSKTTDDTTYNSNSNSFLIKTNYMFAQAFTITSTEINITKIRIVYTITGNPTGDLVIYDSSGSGGSPGSQIANSPNIS